MAAALGFLTSRWLQRLDTDEKAHLEQEFEQRVEAEQKQGNGNYLSPSPRGYCEGDGKDLECGDAAAVAADIHWLKRIVYASLSMSLFVPLPLLVIGAICMISGLLISAWSQHPLLVAILTTTACAATLPFLAGVFMIGRDKGRRKAIISRLSKMQGDW